MRKILVFICAIMIASVTNAQDNQDWKKYKNEFGANMGATTGVGLSYRHWFNKVGFQLTALPIKTDEFAFVSGGVTMLYSFVETKHIRAYGYLGNHYLYTEDRNSDGYGNYSETEYDSKYNIGIGPGFAFGRTVTFNLMFGYGFYDILDKFNMYPTGEIGLYFQF